ncbi:2-polyprenyl-6-methoxyphenol hydroxylase-like FAD-dependent oxidoreductase [Friedmanniella endophytica]|uniref:2-polyprenyl-6-methoxyphenol hydroxylase-like FAD-dependent oxidoreductase n=1 Tax=Microlunatus kandeliicorticis TaxID=1759536 RepID=A0A7W3P5D0_9ACTN|nr:FAD-dependent monooxygenase [Microlunatus kandeliicorticis]MBA8793737.1 2-polyprenyl-6-methoxyphenol hydroxylase-like FAD-dependent oxidoreductase [Microlunatus kandeliicorticis]
MATAVVIGASFAGLLSASALRRRGYDVTVLERDVLAPDTGPRDGVAQSRQPHVLLHRGLLAIESLLPGVEQDLLARGGVPFNTGRMPWFGEHGWSPVNDWSFEIISISRPVLEAVVREHVLAQPGLTLESGARVDGLERDGDRWRVRRAGAEPLSAELVVDATGRSSRLPHWLAELGVRVPEPDTIDAKVGYACRAYRVPDGARLGLRTGILVASTPEHPRGGLALPIENGRWLVCAVGYGDDRPTRDNEAFEPFFRSLRDPALSDLIAGLEPDGDVIIHRQTQNRRQRYVDASDWPGGLLAVGDALCAFNPVYGQGITVSACQAELLASEPTLRAGPLGGAATRRLQRRVGAITELPWSVATSEDLRMPTSDGELTAVQRASLVWTTRLMRLSAAGDEACVRTFNRVYHLMGDPKLLFSPPVVRSVLRSVVRGVPEPLPKPEIALFS